MGSCTRVTLGVASLGVRVKGQDPDLMLKFDPLVVFSFHLGSGMIFPKVQSRPRSRLRRSTLTRDGKPKDSIR